MWSQVLSLILKKLVWNSFEKCNICSILVECKMWNLYSAIWHIMHKNIALSFVYKQCRTLIICLWLNKSRILNWLIFEWKSIWNFDIFIKSSGWQKQTNKGINEQNTLELIRYIGIIFQRINLQSWHLVVHRKENGRVESCCILVSVLLLRSS